MEYTIQISDQENIFTLKEMYEDLVGIPVQA